MSGLFALKEVVLHTATDGHHVHSVAVRVYGEAPLTCRGYLGMPPWQRRDAILESYGITS